MQALLLMMTYRLFACKTFFIANLDLLTRYELLSQTLNLSLLRLVQQELQVLQLLRA